MAEGATACPPPQGNVTQGDILAVMPYGNMASIKSVRGDDLVRCGAVPY